MGSTIKWYDPICYQFSFYMYGKKTEAWNPVEMMRPFLKELLPYYHLWLSLQGRVMVSAKIENTTLIDTPKDPVALNNALLMLEQRSRMLEGYEIVLVPDKTRSRFATPARSIPMELRQEILRYTNVNNSPAMSVSEQKDWLYRMLNCPTDDLEGIHFPQDCFPSKEIPLKLIYRRVEDPKRLLPSADAPDAEDQYSNNDMNLYYFHVSLPRCMLRYANHTFALQQQWEERLLRLCDMFDSGAGSMKMDSDQNDPFFSLTARSKWFDRDSEPGIPDVAWGMCLGQHQAEKLCQLGEVCLSVFDKVQPLANGHLYLRLTPDVSFVPKSKAQQLWKLLYPQLFIPENMLGSIRDVPVSFRLGIDFDHLQLEQYGFYQIIP